MARPAGLRHVIRRGRVALVAASGGTASAAATGDTSGSTARWGRAVRTSHARRDVETGRRGWATGVVVRAGGTGGSCSRSRERREVGGVMGRRSSQGASEGVESVVDRTGGDAGAGALEAGAFNMADCEAAAAQAGIPHGELVSIRAEVSGEAGDVGSVRVRAEGAYGWDHPAVLEQAGIAEARNCEVIGAALPAAPWDKGGPEVSVMGERDREGRCILDLSGEEARTGKASLNTVTGKGRQGGESVSADTGEIIELLGDAFNHDVSARREYVARARVT